MLGNIGIEKVQEAFHSMSAEAAARYLNLGQMMAEQFPMPATISLCQAMTNPLLEALQQIGELAPAGMCIVRWSDRRVTWSNNAYRQYFVDMEKRDVNVGITIEEILPEFKASGLEEIFCRVAETGAPFQATSFPVNLPNAGITFWDWSLTPLPATAYNGYKLLIQMQRVAASDISLAA
jgi:hypothetical protein